MQNFFHTTRKNGFAMLFTVLVISIILSIAIGISNLTFKQTILSSLAKDSQVAFYQADAGVECGLYYDFTTMVFPRGSTTTSVPGAIACGANTLSLDSTVSVADYFVYKQDITDTGKPCMLVVFDKASDPVESVVEARGYSTCRNSPRQVERALRVKY